MKVKHLKFTLEVGEGPEKGLLLTREAAEKTREAIFRKLSGLDADTVLDIDLSSIKYMDGSNAGGWLVMVLKSLELGLYPGVFIVLSNVKDQHRGNMELALRAAGRAVIVREDDGCTILGELMESYKVALHKVMEMGSATARELQKAMDYNTVNEASTKLSSLYKQRLVAREEAAGKSFRYISLFHREGGEKADESEEQ